MNNVLGYLKSWTYYHSFYNDYTTRDGYEHHKPFTIALFNLTILEHGAVFNIGLLGLSYRLNMIKFYKAKKVTEK